jgi:hypothetical protein
MKGRGVENHVIGGKREHHRIGIPLQRDQGPGRDGRSGIASLGLEHHRDSASHLGGLVLREEPKFTHCHHDRRRKQGGIP